MKDTIRRGRAREADMDRPAPASEAKTLAPVGWRVASRPRRRDAKGSSAEGWCRPTKPMNSPERRSSTAQKPQPRCVIRDAQRSAIASLSARVSSDGKKAITAGRR